MYLPIQLYGKSTMALIDTGSDVSLVPFSLVRSRDVVESHQTLRAANGTEIEIVGKAKLRCQAADFIFDVPCLVT